MIKTSTPGLEPEALLARVRAELQAQSHAPGRAPLPVPPPAALDTVKDQAVQEVAQAADDAERLTTVRTRLPKWFNPLFRPQGKVNRALIRGQRNCADILRRTVSLTRWLSSQVESLSQAVRRNHTRIEELTLAVRALEQRNAELERHLNLPPVERANTLAMDQLYVDFEAKFRGAPADIRERLRPYLDVLARHQLAPAAGAALDVGCGRGEWLHLLKEAGWSAAGIDSNQIMVATCREAGLAVECRGAREHLASLADASLAVVTAFHVIEHLPFAARIEFFEGVFRVLQPGGVAIFETPNPRNVQVGSCNFFNDPTHVAPLPPETTRFFVASRGFTEVEILERSPFPPDFLVPGAEPVAARFNHHFYGAQDYALVARK